MVRLLGAVFIESDAADMMHVFVLLQVGCKLHMDIDSTCSCCDCVVVPLESVLFDALVCRRRVLLRSMLDACCSQLNVKHEIYHICIGESCQQPPEIHC